MIEWMDNLGDILFSFGWNLVVIIAGLIFIFFVVIIGLMILWSIVETLFDL